jgi:hypothetical protein
LIVEAMPLTAANLKSENSGATLVNHRAGIPRSEVFFKGRSQKA